MKSNRIGFIGSLALLAAVAFHSDARADTIYVCTSQAPITATPNGANGLVLNTPGSIIGGRQSGPCPETPPIVPTSADVCTTGTPSDLSPTIRAKCAGKYVLHAGMCNPQSDCATVGTDASPLTFKQVFSSDWPGSDFGTDRIFNLSPNEYLSIPIKASPTHTTSVKVNSTYMPKNNAVMTVSTAPGIFNKGDKNGTTVLCGNGRNPNLLLSSNGSVAQCHLDPTKQYWLNIAPGVISTTGEFQACSQAVCVIALTEYFTN